MLESLKNKTLRGAALDVFATEPLPEDSPLWEMDNVIITPHSSGASELSAHRSEDVFIENLPLFLSGDAMKNEIRL